METRQDDVTTRTLQRVARTSREAFGHNLKPLPKSLRYYSRLSLFYIGWIGGLIAFCAGAEWLRGM